MNIIYLRKSREDINKEDSLENHRTILTNLCKNKGWEYTIFEEIGTSDSLEQRTEINKVIKLINEGKVKRVICMALDRLSRNQFDSAFIQKLLMEHNLEVITPSKNYNLNDDSDILLSSFENIISAQEYRLIKRRMAIGKEVKAKQGKITSGVPPLGYKKDKNINKVLVDEEGKKKYRFLVEKFLTGEYSTHTLAIEFNKRFVGNRGKLSNNSRIYKILTNRFYLGYVKFKGKWYEGEHEPLITLEEFKQIENLLKGKSLIKKREGYIEVKKLSQICKCALCGHTLTIKKDKYGNVARCWYVYPDGTRCKFSSVKEDLILDNLNYALDTQIKILEQAYLNKDNDNRNIIINQLQEQIEDNKLLIDRLNIKKNNTISLAQEGIIDLATTKGELNKFNLEIKNLEENIELLKDKIENNNIDNKQRYESFKEVYDTLKNAVDAEAYNTILRKIIKKIEIHHLKKQDVNINIEFL